MHLSFKLFLESQGENAFGPGRAELLRLIEELGSLRKAAAQLGMSYRWAWARLKKAETALGVTLMSKNNSTHGGTAHGLTDEGRALLAWYESVEQRVQAVMEQGEAEKPAFLQPAPGRTARYRNK